MFCPKPMPLFGNSASPVSGELGPHRDLVQQIDLMLRARYPILYIVSVEEEPIEQILQQVTEFGKTRRKLLMWDIVRGWDDNNTAKGSVMAALGRISSCNPGEAYCFVLKDLHPVLKSPASDRNAPVVRELRNIARELKRTASTLILTSHTLVIPSELSEDITVVDLPLPGSEEIDQVIQSTVVPTKLKLTPLAQEQLVKACQGLSRTRIQRLLARALAAQEQIDDSVIDSVLQEKQQAIRQTQILEFLQVRESLKQVGGLENLKQWVQMRRDAFTEEARRYGIPNPKGVLLVGIQGTGKSLSAKTIACEWRLPLLRLDTGRLFGGIVGESESRVRQMIQTAEAMAPCVLWIDEIDKAFGNISSGLDGDSGTSRRVFGTLITWMQEKNAPVFIVATANNVQILPAELLRKGRFDEIFFLNLPTESERADIFRVHLQRWRPTRLREFDLPLLAAQTRQFSGAEIEQAIVDAMHRAFFEKDNQGQRRDFNTQDIMRAVEETVPLAAIARDQIEYLKQWAAEAGARTASNDTLLIEELRRFSIQHDE